MEQAAAVPPSNRPGCWWGSAFFCRGLSGWLDSYGTVRQYQGAQSVPLSCQGRPVSIGAAGSCQYGESGSTCFIFIFSLNAREQRKDPLRVDYTAGGRAFSRSQRSERRLLLLLLVCLSVLQLRTRGRILFQWVSVGAMANTSRSGW